MRTGRVERLGRISVASTNHPSAIVLLCPGIAEAPTYARSLRSTCVSVEKVSELILVTLRYSRYKQARVPDAAVHRHARRPAAHDGTPFPRGIAVLLLPPRRSGS